MQLPGGNTACVMFSDASVARVVNGRLQRESQLLCGSGPKSVAARNGQDAWNTWPVITVSMWPTPGNGHPLRASRRLPACPTSSHGAPWSRNASGNTPPCSHFCGTHARPSMLSYGWPLGTMRIIPSPVPLVVACVSKMTCALSILSCPMASRSARKLCPTPVAARSYIVSMHGLRSPLSLTSSALLL